MPQNIQLYIIGDIDKGRNGIVKAGLGKSLIGKGLRDIVFS